MMKLRTLLVSLLMLLLLSPSVMAEDEIGRGWLTLLDSSGRVLLRTGHQMAPGDVYVCSKNDEYIVSRTVGTFAYADRLRPAQRAAFLTDEALLAQEPAEGNKIVVYHTHSAESYVPSDGTSSIDGRGGIYDVGETFTQALQQQGFDVEHAPDLHNPHDAGAYDRSRRTLVDEMDDVTAAKFDVHRDTGPPGAYEQEIDGETTSQILLVVGRQNPNVKANAAFARELKDAADEQYPGLIRGILFARGKYNQDLHPRSLLLEMGTHHTRKEDAQRAAQLIAEVIPTVLGEQTTIGRDLESEAGIVNTIGIIAVLALAGGTYLIVATGSAKEAKDTLRRFFKKDLGLGKKDDGEQGT